MIRRGRRESLQAGPSTSSRGTKGSDGGEFPEDASVQRVLGQEVHDVTVMMPIKVLRHIVSRAATGKIKNGENQAHHANDVARAYFKHTQHVASVFGALRRGQKSWGQRNAWRNFQCRCTARGPQQETGRNATLTSCTTVDSE